MKHLLRKLARDKSPDMHANKKVNKMAANRHAEVGGGERREDAVKILEKEQWETREEMMSTE